MERSIMFSSNIDQCSWTFLLHILTSRHLISNNASQHNVSVSCYNVSTFSIQKLLLFASKMKVKDGDDKVIVHSLGDEFFPGPTWTPLPSSDVACWLGDVSKPMKGCSFAEGTECATPRLAFVVRLGIVVTILLWGRSNRNVWKSILCQRVHRGLVFWDTVMCIPPSCAPFGLFRTILSFGNQISIKVSFNKYMVVIENIHTCKW